jgi:hypothetical protein
MYLLTYIFIQLGYSISIKYDQYIDRYDSKAAQKTKYGDQYIIFFLFLHKMCADN